MENIETGLLLMMVGMTTVFVILLIVIYLGKGLISVVNKYAPEEITLKRQTVVQPAVVNAFTPGHTPAEMKTTDHARTAAIVSAISVLTGGQGKVTRIEKK